MNNRIVRISDNTIEKITNAIENKDENALKKLFAKNVIDEIEDFSETATKLFSYYKGETISYKSWGTHTEKSKEYDIEEEIFYISYDVTTTEGVFRIAASIVIKDTTDKDNEGIEALYIINMSNHLYPDCAYRGDEKYIPGIYIDLQGTPPPLD